LIYNHLHELKCWGIQWNISLI